MIPEDHPEWSDLQPLQGRRGCPCQGEETRMNTDLTALRERVSGLSGPDREVDFTIGALWPDPPFNLTAATLRNRKPPCPEFTTSLDAVLALVERVLPGWTADLYLFGDGSGGPEANVYPKDQPFPVERDVWGEGKTLAIALLLALLSAMESQSLQQEGGE